MVKFLCLYPHILSNKPKKTIQRSVETMQKTLDVCSENDCPQIQDTKNSYGPSQGVFFDGHCSKSEGSSSNYSIQQEKGSGQFRKSMSLGSGLDGKGMASVGSDLEDEKIENEDGTIVLVGGKDLEIGTVNESQEALPSDSFQVCSDLGNNDSIFSIGDAPKFGKDESKVSELHCFGDRAGDTNDGTPIGLPFIEKSKSLFNICSSTELSALENVALHSRSSEDLTVLNLRRMEKDRTILNDEENTGVEGNKDGYDSFDYVGSAKDWVVPVMDEVNARKHLYRESTAHRLEELPSKDFKTKRIEEWVSDLQYCSPLEETNDGLSNVDDYEIQRDAVDNLTTARFDVKINPGMEAAKKYISSLSPAATAAQLTNLGLVVIPLLSAFVSLRTLNLSGNFIVRITAGALPRALHVLNLSKNSISTIEGLRELTRLRVLDLSYNRIVRIGHGLASCSSLKELYLAGNKISEVEGLHRLLKLNVLDLHFNKISTAKSLGQLAANYCSLQAISLEGNPAQKNVGDEHLKKYLQGLLPQLAYFNRLSIKPGTLSDTSDRSARMGITSNRGLRSDHKTSRKGNHSGAAQSKSFSSSIHGHRNQGVSLPKPSKGRPARLPPTGTKSPMARQHNFYDFRSKILGFGHDLSMGRSRSEGNLAAL